MSGAPLLPASVGFPSLLQDFFCQRLIGQRNVTARTVAAYPRRVPAAVALHGVTAPPVAGCRHAR